MTLEIDRSFPCGTSIPGHGGECTTRRIPCGRATMGSRPSTLEARSHRHHQPPRLADHHRVHERSDRGVADLRHFGQKARHPRRRPARDGWQQLGAGSTSLDIWIIPRVPPLVGSRFHRPGLGSTGHARQSTRLGACSSSPANPAEPSKSCPSLPTFGNVFTRLRATKAAHSFSPLPIPAPGWKNWQQSISSGASLQIHRTSVDATQSSPILD